MKKLLPKTSTNIQGFTLIELLVVIAIIAILAIVGFALLTQTQARARDSKRVQDIVAMSKAMEANYVVGTGYATVVQTNWFSDQIVPVNPGPNGATYATTSMTTSTYTFCASLENSTGNATSSTGTGLGTASSAFFCKRNQQ